MISGADSEPLTGSLGSDANLVEVLEKSRDLGFLGPGPVQDHLRHARVFVEPLAGIDKCLDLGSGGGLPGLALAWWLPHLHITLVDAARKRCDFLSAAVQDLAVEDRVEVRWGRAETLARHEDLRGRFPVVVARSFGSPAVTAECAAGFLDGPGARILVSEPPDERGERWPAAGLKLLGLDRGPRLHASGASLQVLQLTESVDPRIPRRDGVPAKRPFF